MVTSNAAESPLKAAAGTAGSAAIEAFSTLGNETRLAILVALWEAFEPFAPENAVSFSELRERVGVADSGQFNYHLDRLVGHFVEDREAGYVLTQAGIDFVRVVIAGTGLEPVSVDPTELELPCPVCEAEPLELRYADESVEVRCSHCEGRFRGDDPSGFLLRLGLPPSGLSDRTPIQLLMASHVRAWGELQMLRAGVCPICSGVVETSVLICDDHAPDHGEPCPACGARDSVRIRYACTVCKTSHQSMILAETGDHPGVECFYHSRGVDRRLDSRDPEGYRSTWDQHWAAEHRVVSTNPVRIEVTYPHGEDELRLTLDRELNVLETATNPV